MELVVKNLHESPGDLKDGHLIPGLRKSPGEGSHNPLQYCSLEKSMDRGLGQATVPGVAESRTRLKWLSMAQHKTEIDAVIRGWSVFYPHGWELIHIKTQETDKVFENFVLAEMHSSWTERDRHHTHKGRMPPKIELYNRASFSWESRLTSLVGWKVGAVPHGLFYFFP